MSAHPPDRETARARSSPPVPHSNSQLYTAVVADALDAVGHRHQTLHPRIRPIVAVSEVIVGRAATARSVRCDEIPAKPYADLLLAIDDLSPGDVWLVEAGGTTRSGIFGGLLANAARARGAIACVVDGGVRDSRELQRLGFPTFATGRNPADSNGREEIVDHGVPVTCGEVTVSPGNLVVADADGVVVVPREVEEVVIAKALAKIAQEGEMRDELRDGTPLAVAFSKYGVL